MNQRRTLKHPAEAKALVRTLLNAVKISVLIAGKPATRTLLQGLLDNDLEIPEDLIPQN